MMVKRKTSLSALDMAALIAEIKPVVIDSYLSKIYQVGEIFIFRLVTVDGNKRDLILSPKYGFWLTKYRFRVPKAPPTFCQQLRRKLTRLKLVDIRQHDLDRVVFFKFGNYVVVLEVVREGNLILLDENSRILLALRYMKMRDRDVIPKVGYKPPPPRGANVLETSFEDFVKIAEKFSESKLISALLRTLGLPKDVVEHVLNETRISCELKLKSLTQEQLKELYDKLTALVRECLKGTAQGVIVYKGETPVGVFPYVLKTRKDLPLKLFKSFNESVDEYFSNFIVKEFEEAEVSKLKEELEKLSRVLERQRELKEKYEREANELRRVANELYGKFHELSKLFKEIVKLKERGYNWDLIKERVSHLPSVSVNIVDVDLAKSEIVIELDGMRVKLDLKRSVGDNLSNLYERAKLLERKCKRIEEEMKNTLNKIEELMKSKETVKQEVIIGVVRERKWYERFRWFISSKGFLVIAGRNATQNERIVRKYLEDNDIFMHAEIHGAPVVVIKTYGKQVDEDTLKEAAEFAASFSKAWELGFTTIDVYWVRGSQVSKSPPSGMYLAKGSFMIYGKRNYLRKVKLAIAVGVRFSDGQIKILCGPINSIKTYCEKYVVLIPGKRSRNEIAKEIISIFAKHIKRKNPQAKVRIPLDEVLTLLPYDGSSFLIKE